MAKLKLITTAIAAKMLGLTADYIRQLCSKGKIEAQRVGHDWIFTEEDIKHIKRQRNKKES